ncbi:putative ribonuclease H-like domain-containing protein [Tanacetum coccineum]
MEFSEGGCTSWETHGFPAPKTAKQLTAKRNQERVKSILLLAIPDEYLLKFHNVPDAKSLWAAIKSRFGGNDESKKMQRNVLKPSQLHKTRYDIDDLYNNLMVYEDGMKRSLSSISNSHNLAFLSSENTSSTNEVSPASEILELILLEELIHQVMFHLLQVAFGCYRDALSVNYLIYGTQEYCKGKMDNALKKSSILQDHAMVDSGCSSHMTGNKAYLSDYKDYNGGFVAFVKCPKGGFLLKSIVLRAPRQNGVYSLDLKNIVPSGGLENQLNHKVKIIRSDHETEFKNHAMNEFCAKKGIKREFSVARTLLQNGVAERKNRTLIEAPRTMLADSLLPIPFWAEVVNTACYVLNKVLVTKPQNKTPYELLIGKPPSISFIRLFGCPLTILNALDPLRKFDRKSDEGYLLGYSTTRSGPGSSEKDKEPTQEYILLPLHPHRPRILVEDVVQAAQEKPSKTSPKDTFIQDSEDVTEKEEEHMLTEADQALQDDLERMIAQEIAAKTINDATRQAFKEEKKRAAQATNINKLNTGRPSIGASNSPLVSTANTPYASVASTPTGVNTGGASFVYLRGQIPIDASTLPNADLPIDPNMNDLEDDSNVFPNDAIFSGAYDDEDVGAEADFNNMDNTIDVSPIPTLRVHKDHPKGQILGDPKSAV